MTIKDWIKKKILSFLGLEKLSESPNDERLTFISNDEELKFQEIKANKVWFLGSGDELLNFYTQRQTIGFASNPIYNRNKRNYFWSLSSQECDIKRIHSGIPNAIITTLSNVIGMPDIKAEGWDEIAEENDFVNKLCQQGRPLTMVCGYGAWKPNFNKSISNVPLWEYYDGEYVKYIYKCGVLMGIIFKSYYKDKNNKDYVLLETRYRGNGNSYIEYKLFKLKKDNSIEPAELDKIPELKDIPREPIVIKGLNKVLAVPSKYLYDPLNHEYGKSIYAGKLDFFDMLDEIWSQASQTNRVSTPVEYYSPDILERSNNGLIGMPKLYNRQFVQKAGIADGDGNISQDIITTQPDLNFDKYGYLAQDVLNNILSGILSPATLGISVSSKDNAQAQREKEKVTIMTRSNIINSETRMIHDIVDLSLYLKEYMDTGEITLKPHSININYNEFANPSFENQLQILGTAWIQGELSTEKYIDLLWGDKLSKEDKQKELEWLNNNRMSVAPANGPQGENIEQPQSDYLDGDMSEFLNRYEYDRKK